MITFTSSFKYLKTTHDDDYGIQHHFTASFINDDETEQLNIIFSPTATEYQFSIDIDGDAYSSDTDTIIESQYFDDNAIAFFKSFKI